MHAGPLEHDGSLDPALSPGAAALIADVHRVMPGVRGRRTFGLALHVDFRATAADWAAYRSGWGTPRKP